MDDGTQKIGRIIEIYEDKAVIQVFEGTDNMSLGNTHTRLTGHPMEIGLSTGNPRPYLQRYRTADRRTRAITPEVT